MTNAHNEEHALVRAQRLAVALHDTFGLGRDSLLYLLTRWRDREGLHVRNDVLEPVCTMVVRDAFFAQPPVTKEEAAYIATEAARGFSTLELARREIQGYAKRRNASPDQCLRMDALVRDAWHQRQATEVHDAAA